MADQFTPQQLAAAAQHASAQAVAAGLLRAGVAKDVLCQLIAFARVGEARDPDWPEFPVEESVDLAVRLADALVARLSEKANGGRRY